MNVTVLRRGSSHLLALAGMLIFVTVGAQPATPVSKTRVVHSDPANKFPKQNQMRRASSASSSSSPACSASHPQGYEMLYAYPNDVASRFSSLQNAFLADAASAADRMSNDSQAAPVRPRFYCGIAEVKMPQASSAYGTTDPLTPIMTDLGGLGYNEQTRKYVVWWDGSPRQDTCGEGTFTDDNRADPGVNANNAGPDYAVIYKDPTNNSFCGWTTVLHEMGHTLGAVMKGAPHQTANWHCTDQQDIMCYVDGPGVVMSQTCPGSYLYFDCNHDDYFSVAPLGGSYLATHWNTYNSSFLERVPAQGPPPSPSPSPTSNPPTVSLNSPTVPIEPDRSIPLSWSGTGTSYTVRYRKADTSSWFGSYSYWTQQSTGGTFQGYPGSTYCFSVQATDDAGNASSWTAERCTSVPLDDRSGSSYKFARSTGGSFYQGTVSVARSAGARLTWSNINAKVLNVTVQMCGSCRYVDVIWNGATIKRMALQSRSAHLATVPLATFSGNSHGTLVLIVRSPNIVIDSLGVSQV